jgi:SUMO ligase MMS21 Smc5/6 complex component
MKRKHAMFSVGDTVLYYHIDTHYEGHVLAVGEKITVKCKWGACYNQIFNIDIPNVLPWDAKWRENLTVGDTIRYHDGLRSPLYAIVVSTGEELEIQLSHSRVNKRIPYNSPRIGPSLKELQPHIRQPLDNERERNDKYLGCRCVVYGIYGYIIDVDYESGWYCFYEGLRYPSRNMNSVFCVHADDIEIITSYNVGQRGISNKYLGDIRVKTPDIDIQQLVELDKEYAFNYLMKNYRPNINDEFYNLYALLDNVGHRAKVYNPYVDINDELDIAISLAYTFLTGTEPPPYTSIYSRGRREEWYERTTRVLDLKLLSVGEYMVFEVYYNGVLLSDMYSKPWTMNILYLRFIMDQLISVPSMPREITFDTVFDYTSETPYGYQGFLTDKMLARENSESYTSDVLNKDIEGIKYNLACGFMHQFFKSRSGILCLKPGLGKTVIMLNLIKRSPVNTLIVVPLTLIDQWKDECRRFVPSIKVTECYGRKRDMSGTIVLTTYGQIRQFSTMLFMRTFGRVVFDESHEIKSLRKTAEACRNISAKYRWCLTGTLHTNLERFAVQCYILHISPWANNHVGCMTDLATHHPGLVQTVINELLFNVNVPAICSNLDHKTITLEHNGENALICAQYFTQHLATKYLESNHTHAFVEMIMTRLNIIATDPSILPLSSFAERLIGQTRTIEGMVQEIKASDASEGYKDTITNELQQLNNQCIICMEPYESPVITPCYHIYCQECLSQALAHAKQCPTCRAPMGIDNITKLEGEGKHVDGMYEFVEFTGRFRLPNEIYQAYQHTEESNKFKYVKGQLGHQSLVVFSRFSSVLSALQKYLLPYKVGIITGKTSRKNRARAIQGFQQKDIDCFLLTTKTAAVGINLTAGSKIIFMEPQDSSIVTQAIGRLNRIGQENDIVVETLVTKNTIECYEGNMVERLTQYLL